MAEPLLEVKNLKKYFQSKGGIFSKPIGYVYAVDGVSFYLNKGRAWVWWVRGDVESRRPAG
jgi:ABC-type oligopeptide transport system ATPase subunit